MIYGRSAIIYAHPRIKDRYFIGWYRTGSRRSGERQWPPCPRCGISMPHAIWDREEIGGRLVVGIDTCVDCTLEICNTDDGAASACPKCHGHGNIWTGEPFRYTECPDCGGSGLAS